MIGLGSNRLTVCRRGGMSVTQAGRGGMEWLGVRVPSWASPYSAQATAALKAQFPTQWPTIRDYGVSHPEIVPYVNANPLGFGELIAYYQMCEYFNTNGANALQVTLPQSGLIMSFTIMKTASGTGEAGCAGRSGTSEIYFMNGKLYDWSSSQLIQPTSGSNAPDNTKIDVIAKFTHDGMLNIGAYDIGRYVWTGNIYGASIATEQDEQVFDLIPCYNKTSGEIGAFDVLGRQFYENKGSGTFLKGSDIYYPGQSPS